MTDVECCLCGSVTRTPIKDRPVCLDCVMELSPCTECGNQFIQMDSFEKNGGGIAYVILCRQCNNHIKDDSPKLLYAIWESFERIDGGSDGKVAEIF